MDDLESQLENQMDVWMDGLIGLQIDEWMDGWIVS